MQEQIEAVQRMQDYIMEHLRDELTFVEVAQASLFSPWYARKLFVEYLGVTPAEYIRKLRLKNSALQLRDNNCKVLDVAMEFGFGSFLVFVIRPVVFNVEAIGESNDAIEYHLWPKNDHLSTISGNWCLISLYCYCNNEEVSKCKLKSK